MTTVRGCPAGLIPEDGSVNTWVATRASTSVRIRRLMKPGPAISSGSHRSPRSICSTSRAATSRGFVPSALASRSATLVW